MEREQIRLLVADDHQVVQDGIKLLLRKVANFEIVAAVNNGEEAFEYLQNNTIDVLLTDISMPKMDGLTLTKKVKADFPEIKVIILSMHNETSIVQDAISAEADGYVLKNTGRKELEEAILKVANGGIYYSAEIVKIIMKGIKLDKKIESNTKTLSDREIEVLQLVCDELTTNEIAEKLFLSPLTIDTHRKNILKKTGTKSIVGLIKFAIANQLVDLN
ncbi:MAG: response regulator transcription factor [Chitinophagales bacterium]